MFAQTQYKMNIFHNVMDFWKDPCSKIFKIWFVDTLIDYCWIMIIIISIIGLFWSPYMKFVVLSESPWISCKKFIDLLILLIRHNNHFNHMHIQINNIESSPIKKLTCKTQNSHHICTHITKISIVTSKVGCFSLHTPCFVVSLHWDQNQWSLKHWNQ